MSAQELETLEAHPAGEADASVIWLHGLGASGHDFGSCPPALRLPDDLRIRFIFPHAPNIPVTLNNGMVMPAWYDIEGLENLEQRESDLDGVTASQRRVEQLVRRENERGMPCDRIVLGGFSMGGAIGLYTGLRFEEKLAGLMGLSSYLLLGSRLAEEASGANRDTPVFLGHGTMDPMVPFEMGTECRDALTHDDRTPSWNEYPMAHNVSLDEFRDIGRWLVSVLRD
ncbi:MAG: carboxylesterase [Acidobacteriota bacterium]